MEKAKIGFSTGSLYKTDISFDDRIKLFHSLGATAIELSFSTLSQLENFKLTPEITSNVEKYDYVSIHAPFNEINYGSNKETDKLIEQLKYLCKALPVDGIVLHPDVVDDFQKMENSGLPFLIENMDKRKIFGTNPEQFKKLAKDYNFGFVLDIQHAYEHDPSMKLAGEFIEVMGKRLKEMHVSGCTEAGRHLPTYVSDNKQSIAKILKLGINIPKILEGRLEGNIQQVAREEINFIKSFEK